MKLSIVFPVLNQFELATEAITMAVQQLSGENEVSLLVLDNGSDTPYELPEAYKPLVEGPLGGNVKIHRSDKNIGVYPTFWAALEQTSGDILAFFHSDTIVAEKDWDKRVIAAFEEHPKLGLLGFIGSDEIDSSGGRGLGTASNFLGGELVQHGVPNPKTWKGSPAEDHGKRLAGYMNAAVVDGCAMIFRSECLMKIPQRMDFGIHHFYDKLLSCEVLEHGYEVGVLGIGFDHISGQTVNQEDAYQHAVEEWCLKHGVQKNEKGWDATMYLYSEGYWLSEYRDIKKFMPLKVHA